MKTRRSRLLIALALVACLLIGISMVRQFMRMQGLNRLHSLCPSGTIQATFRDPRFWPPALWQDFCHYSDKWWGKDFKHHPRYMQVRWLTFGSLEHLSVRTNLLHDGAGQAIAGISTLRGLMLMLGPGVSESQAATLCADLRRLPNLQTLYLSGLRFTDASLAPLAGHDRIYSIDLSGTRITGNSLPTFASLPRLRWLTISPPEAGGFSMQDRDALQAALPKVRLTLRTR
jgi:hypothetical protein